MEYQKILNLLDDTTNQQSKFTARNCGEINDESRVDSNDDNNDNNGDNNDNNKFKTTVIRISLCDYSDTCILV